MEEQDIVVAMSNCILAIALRVLLSSASCNDGVAGLGPRLPEPQMVRCCNASQLKSCVPAFMQRRSLASPDVQVLSSGLAQPRYAQKHDRRLISKQSRCQERNTSGYVVLAHSALEAAQNKRVSL